MPVPTKRRSSETSPPLSQNPCFGKEGNSCTASTLPSRRSCWKRPDIIAPQPAEKLHCPCSSRPFSVMQSLRVMKGAELEQDCALQQIPQPPTKERSLEELRNSLASQSDALVAIGGKWWDEDRSRAGVPAEFLLAVARGIPVFLLGGLGGATAGYLERHPEILRNLRNGLDTRANENVSSSF